MAEPNVGAIAATSIKNYRKTLADNLSTHSVVLATIRNNGMIVEDEGGTHIVETLLYGSNNTVKAYAKYDLFDLTPQEGIDQAEFAWKQLGGTVTISGWDEFVNSSKTRIVNYLEGKLKQLDISFREDVDRQILSDGTGESGKEITGLQAAVEDGTAWSVYGKIDSNTYTWWRNYYLNFTGTYTSFNTDSGKSIQGMDMFRNAYTSLVRKSDKPSLILTTPEIYNLYEAYAEGSKMRIMADKTLIDMGFDNIKFKNAILVYDDGVPTGFVWWLNSEYLKFTVGKGRNFKVGNFVEAREQDARSAKIILYAQLTVSNRARQGLVTNVA